MWNWVFFILTLLQPLRVLAVDNCIVGDINRDGTVDLRDYVLLITNFGKTGSNVADLNGDGVVDLRDFSFLITNFGKMGSCSATPTPPPTGSGQTYYLDSLRGDDQNPGTLTKPWKTLEHATSTTAGVKSGDMVLLRGGIYSQTRDGLTFGPAGSAGRPTIFAAFPGETPIVTYQLDPNSGLTKPPSDNVSSYTRIQGLWFGGQRASDVAPDPIAKGDNSTFKTGGKPISRGVELIGNTFFNYMEAISTGSTQDALFQDNRFVNNGYGNLVHTIYISGDDMNKSGGASNHVIVDHNIIIGFQGYGLQGWHQPHNLIYSRNFFSGANWGANANGSDNLIVNNVFWHLDPDPKQPGVPKYAGGYLSVSRNTMFLNNVFGANGGVSDSLSQDATKNITFDSNVFDVNGGISKTLDTLHADSNVASPGGIYDSHAPRGTHVLIMNKELPPTYWQHIDPATLESNYFSSGESGKTLNDIGTAIQDLRAHFASGNLPTIQSQVAAINADFDSIRALQVTPVTTNPLYQKGKNWFGTGPINIGPGATAPSSAAAFWTAFNTLGFQNWDRCDETPPDPVNCP